MPRSVIVLHPDVDSPLLSSIAFTIVCRLRPKDYGTGLDVYLLDKSDAAIIDPATFLLVITKAMNNTVEAPTAAVIVKIRIPEEKFLLLLVDEMEQEYHAFGERPVDPVQKRLLQVSPCRPAAPIEVPIEALKSTAKMISGTSKCLPKSPRRWARIALAKAFVESATARQHRWVWQLWHYHRPDAPHPEYVSEHANTLSILDAFKG